MRLLEEVSSEDLAKMSSLGYFLGSFDPIHDGHVKVVDLVLQRNLCEYVLVYCVNGLGNYKKRSDFVERTKACESALAQRANAIVSYMNLIQIQRKLTIVEDGVAKLRFPGLKITAIIGSDVALNLETENPDAEIEKLRQMRQQDYMRGVPVNESCYDSSACASFLRASDVIIALRDDHQTANMPKTVCGLNVTAIIDTEDRRFQSSSAIRLKK